MTASRRLAHPPRREWAWINPRYQTLVTTSLNQPLDALAPVDRYHAKQGRMTGRLRLDAGGSAISVYLKRHERWPWWSRWRAGLGLPGPSSPAGAEWRNLEAVAAGERVERDGSVCSYLIVREVAGEELHRAAPRLAGTLDPAEYARLKRSLVGALARLVARLHTQRLFHKDLYLCHVFLAPDASRPIDERLVLIDLQRLARHRWTAWRWLWKDLGQLLYSTDGVAGIDRRDRLRFWRHYRRATRLRFERLHRLAIQAKAARYRAHNRGASR
jgi:heptose I phosphotransferase